MLWRSWLVVACFLGLLPVPRPVVIDAMVVEMKIWPEMDKAGCGEWEDVDHQTSCRLCRAEGLVVMGIPVEWVGEWKRPVGRPLGPVREYWIPRDRFGDVLGVLVHRYGPPKFSRPTVGAKRLSGGAVVARFVGYGMYWDVKEGGLRYHVTLDGKAVRGLGAPCQPSEMELPCYRLVVEALPGSAD